MRVVIIGAGKTGRGFITPILVAGHHEITFIDKDQQLVKYLKAEGEYQVQYYDGSKAVCIESYEVYHDADKGAIDALAEADLVFTSVFASYLKDVVPLFKQALTKRVKAAKLNIICCENGVNVTQVLLDSHIDANIAQGIVFCTTMNIEHSLNLISESYPNIPIDNHKHQFHFDSPNLLLIEDFDSLIERKIYTYNYLSAIIAYIGSYLGYTIYGEAANDPMIIKLTDVVVMKYVDVMVSEYAVSYEEQLAFTQMALRKFRNIKIGDTIERNAIQVKRKLSKKERMITPFLLMRRYHKNVDSFLILMACAIKYAVDHREDSNETLMAMIASEIQDEVFISKLQTCYTYIVKHVDLSLIIKEMNLCVFKDA